MYEGLVTNKSGKVVGKIANRVFSKQVKGSIHMLKIPMAWAIDADVFDKVVARTCSTIQITDIETRTMYTVAVKVFGSFRMKLNRRAGDQYALPLVRWEVTKI